MRPQKVPKILLMAAVLGLAGLAATMGCTPASSSPGPVQTGAEMLVENEFETLAGKRVGLITNPTARVENEHLIDVLAEADRVELTALFGPEHGLRGHAAAGEAVESGRDAETGVPIHSLYGDQRRPSQAMLDSVDVLVFDIQDIGARFYTYISTMGLAMQAAAEAKIPFVVLDRPNPLGGEYVSGFVIDSSLTSFVGKYPIPIAHGMTTGELARMIRGEGLLPGLEHLDLTVVQMCGWERSMRWQETGLSWLAPSPNIPDFHAALLYPGTAFLEGTSVSEGRGTAGPFAYVGAPWIRPEALAEALNRRALPGVQFYPITFSPRSISGVAPNPKWENRLIFGVRQSITDLETFQPVETGVHLLDALYRQAPDSVRGGSFFRSDWLANLAGTRALEQQIANDYGPEQIIAGWHEEVRAFRSRRSPYLLYE